MTREIPMLRRDGSVRAVALVDDEDYKMVSGYHWRLDRGGYALTLGNFPDRPGISMHRLLLGLQPPADRAGRVVDHINGDRLDNRRANLRIVSAQGNAQNRRAWPASSSGGLRGVTWHKQCGKWQASVGHNGRKHYLGLFETKDAAAAAASAFRAAKMPLSPDAISARGIA